MGYFELILITVILVGCLFVCYTTSKKILITPEFCFVLCFIPQVVYALGFVKKWDIDLSVETILVYVGGIVLFVLSSIFFRSILGRKGKGQYRIECMEPTLDIHLSNLKLIVFIAFQLLSLVLVIRMLFALTESDNLSKAISVYTINNKANGMSMRGFAGKLNMLCYTSGYIWAYYLADSIIFRRTGNKILIIANLGLSFLHQLISGSRGGVIEVLIAMVVYVWFFYEMKKQWRGRIQFRHIVRIIGGAAIALYLFQAILPYLGRTAGRSFSDYLGIYLSAELKNLDIMIRNGEIGPKPVKEWQTIARLLNFFRRRLSLRVGEQFFSFYQYVNGMNLGNVYTIFYSFINDLGYIGILIYVPLMSFLCQFSLASAVQKKSRHFRLNMSILLYGYIITRVAFSFFSARFYEQIVQTGFIWTIAFLLLVRMFMESRFPRFRVTERLGFRS